MRAARIENGVVADLWEVPALDCYDNVTLVSAPENVGMGWGYAGDVFTAPARVLSEVVAAKIAQLTKAYHAAIQQPVAYMGTTFQANTASQDMIAKSLAPDAVPGGFAWLDAENSSVPMTMAQLRGLAGAMLAQGWAAFQELQERKATVRAATTIAQIDAMP